MENKLSSQRHKSQVERVKVHCRIRPVLGNEIRDGCEVAAQVTNDNKSRIRLLHRGEERLFQFDSCLGPQVGQDTLYDVAAEPIIASVLNGYNGTIFAYGQTGSGKTHSMFGSGVSKFVGLSGDQKSNEKQKPYHAADTYEGVIPRSLQHLFLTAQNDESNEYRFTLSYVQIYCEMISDLLVPENSNLSIREDHSDSIGGRSNSNTVNHGVYIEGASSFLIQTPEEALEFIRVGDENRCTAATDMNAASSRSHACLIINMERRPVEAMRQNVEKANSHVATPNMLRGKLILVDLAGSERVKKALGNNHPNGARFTESKAINLSLSALGNCIWALATKKKHVPYRDAKLTRLLQDSLGGNCMTSLILNIGPCDYNASETYSSLQFGQRAMSVETRVHLNEEVDYKVLYNRLQRSLDSKDDEVHAVEIRCETAETELAKVKKQLEQVTLERNALRNELVTCKSSSESEISALKELLSKTSTGLQLVPGTTKHSMVGYTPGTLDVDDQQQAVQHAVTSNNMGDEHASTDDVITALERTKSHWQKRVDDLVAQHSKTLAKIQSEATSAYDALASKYNESVEEWHSLEKNLATEKEEHLATCKLLREKQTQLRELEIAMGERVAELLQQMNDAADKSTLLEMKVEAANKERNELNHRLEDVLVSETRLKAELEKSHEYQARTLQLMDTLTARVEHLENRRGEQQRGSLTQRSYTSTGSYERSERDETATLELSNLGRKAQRPYRKFNQPFTDKRLNEAIKNVTKGRDTNSLERRMAHDKKFLTSGRVVPGQRPPRRSSINTAAAILGDFGRNSAALMETFGGNRASIDLEEI